MASRTYIKPTVEALLRHLTPDEQAIPGASQFGNSRISEVIKHLNGALQEISKNGPHWPGEEGWGLTINAPTEITNVAITAGNRHACARSAEGSITCWGRQVANDLVAGAPTTGVIVLDGGKGLHPDITCVTDPAATDSPPMTASDPDLRMTRRVVDS